MTFTKTEILNMLKVPKKTFNLALEVLEIKNKRKFTRDDIERISNQLRIMIP